MTSGCQNHLENITLGVAKCLMSSHMDYSTYHLYQEFSVGKQNKN